MHGLIGRESVVRVNVTITAIGSPPYDCTCELIGFSGRQPTSLSALWRAHRVHAKRGALNDSHGGCDKERAFRTVSPDDDHVFLLRAWTERPRITAVKRLPSEAGPTPVSPVFGSVSPEV